MLEGMLSKIVRMVRTDAPGVTVHDVGLVLVAFSVLGSLGYSVFTYGPRLARMATHDAAPIETATIKLVEAPQPVTRPRPAPAPAATPALMRDVVPETSFEIVRKLQTGLKRAGCYRGKVNGAWTSTSRRAMRSYAETVNATLPVDKPNAVLLALIDANPDARCGGRKGHVAARAATQPSQTQTSGGTETSQPSAESRDSATGTVGAAARPYPRPALIPTTPTAVEPEAVAAPKTVEAPPPRKRRRTKKRSKAPKSPANLADSFFKDVQKAFKNAF